MRLRLSSFASLLESRRIWSLACHSPWMFAGDSLHLGGLRALAAGEHATAEALFESAASRYRAELKTEALARVRVHQLMARARSAGGRMSPTSLEVDRALTRLDRIESPEPPFELVPAHVLLATWLNESEVESLAPPRAA